MRVFACISVAGLLCVAAFSQVYTAPPAFEIAEVHTSTHIWNPVIQGGILRTGRYELRQATMLDLVRTTYGAMRIH